MRKPASPQARKPRAFRPRLERLEDRTVPATAPWQVETYDAIAGGGFPADWQQWDNLSTDQFSVSTASPFDATDHGFIATAQTSAHAGRAWLDRLLPADVEVTASVYLDTLNPAHVLVRGTDLDTSAPSYYALSITRNLTAVPVKVENGGTPTPLASSIDSEDYVSGQWVTVTVRVTGTRLQAAIFRPSTAEYLDRTGEWQSYKTYAFDLTDSSLTGPGYAGIGRPAQQQHVLKFDDFRVGFPDPAEDFDRKADGSAAPVGGLPAGWQQYSPGGNADFYISRERSTSGFQSLVSAAGLTTASARAWWGEAQDDDVLVRSDVYLNSLNPVQVLARGANLNGSAPDYYAAQVKRGMELQLVKVVGGTATNLGSAVTSSSWVSNEWVRVTLEVTGSTVRAEVYRPGTKQYLNSAGNWQSGRTWAASTTDTSIPGGGSGFVGLARPNLTVDTVAFDNFTVLPASTAPYADAQAPSVSVSTSASGAVVTVTPSVSDDVLVSKVEYYVDGFLTNTQYDGTTWGWDFDTRSVADGSRTVMVRAYDGVGNVAEASTPVTVSNGTSYPQPVVPAHQSHIRSVQLVYSGADTTLASGFEELLPVGADVVVSHLKHQARIDDLSPGTPQLLYTNVSNIYPGDNLSDYDTGPLLDWLNYADANGLDREGAFFHVDSKAEFTVDADGGSTRPVNYFWRVLRHENNAWTDLTNKSTDDTPSDVEFPLASGSLYLAYPERFREINIDLSSLADGTYSYVLEYPTAVDGNGKPTSWASVTILSDNSGGLKTSTGLKTIVFDPVPATDWVTASVNGSGRMYWVRFRVTAGTTAPKATTVLGHDYLGWTEVGANHEGFYPAFDYLADANDDGYLDDAEYVERTEGMDARFAYEARVLTYYGQSRYWTNPANAGFQDWAADYAKRLLLAYPLADGLWYDNQGTKIHSTSLKAYLDAGQLVESLDQSSYSTNFGTIFDGIYAAIAPRWVSINSAAHTDGSVNTADPVIQETRSYFEEKGIQAMLRGWKFFERVAADYAHWAALSPAPVVAVLDSASEGGSRDIDTDMGKRTFMATLAYYYQIADPDNTYLDFFGGNDPGPQDWEEHWFPAAEYDIGTYSGAYAVFASGTDPQDSTMTYRVYKREFENATVFFKPRSINEVTFESGTLDPATATTHQVSPPTGYVYRELFWNGDVGTTDVTEITLLNGQGIILIKVLSGGLAPQTSDGGGDGSLRAAALDSSEGPAAPADEAPSGLATAGAAVESPASTPLLAPQAGVVSPESSAAVFAAAGSPSPARQGIPGKPEPGPVGWGATQVPVAGTIPGGGVRVTAVAGRPSFETALPFLGDVMQARTVADGWTHRPAVPVADPEAFARQWEPIPVGSNPRSADLGHPEEAPGQAEEPAPPWLDPLAGWSDLLAVWVG